MILTKEQIKEFETVTDAVIKFLNNFHPHCKVIIDSGRAEFLEGKCAIKNEKHWKD
jgi:protein involved in ribonucleotide reduction